MGGAGGGGAEGGDFRAKVWSMSGGPYCRPKHWRRNTAFAMLGVFLVCIPIAMKSAELEGWAFGYPFGFGLDLFGFRAFGVKDFSPIRVFLNFSSDLCGFGSDLFGFRAFGVKDFSPIRVFLNFGSDLCGKGHICRYAQFLHRYGARTLKPKTITKKSIKERFACFGETTLLLGLLFCRQCEYENTSVFHLHSIVTRIICLCLCHVENTWRNHPKFKKSHVIPKSS